MRFVRRIETDEGVQTNARLVAGHPCWSFNGNTHQVHNVKFWNTSKFWKFAKMIIPKALRNGSRGHFTGIARQKRLQLKYFKAYKSSTAEEWYEIWYDIIFQAMNCPYLHFAEHLQHMILNWLEDHGQQEAVAWFSKLWMLPDDDRWMLCHFEHGRPFNNNGTEGNNGGFKGFTLGQAGEKTALTPTHLVANTCQYLTHKSEEQRHELSKSGTTAMFRNLPSVTGSDVHTHSLALLPMVKRQDFCFGDSWGGGVSE